MDAEQHSRILLAMGKVLEGLVRESKEHQAAAKQALSESQKATKQLEAATSDYKQIATTLPDKVKTAIAESLNGAADIAGDRLAANFSEAC